MPDVYVEARPKAVREGVDFVVEDSRGSRAFKTQKEAIDGGR
jgi:hypothetical protein